VRARLFVAEELDIRLKQIADRLIHRSPSENVRALGVKLRTGSADFDYGLQTVLRSPHHMDARRPIDRFFRYQRVLRNQIPWQDLQLEGKTVLEIGSGPLLGWAPLAVYLGCERYYCVEPRMRFEPLGCKEIEARFLLPMHQQLEALFERRLAFADFKKRLRDRTRCLHQVFERCQLPDAKVDLLFSNNVLQHVADVESCFEQMRRVCRPSTQQFHVIHFTDHESPPDRPFDVIYSRSPKQYFETRSLLNLKRPSEVLELFERNGMHVRLVPYYRDEAFSMREVHPDWRRFESGDLDIQIAFFVS
jgi:SAM-dependent methyltransferase